MNTPPFDSPGFGVAILAAGASRRMGSPKALLSWQGRTILEHLLTTWKEAGAWQVAVVFDPENEAVAMELDRLKITDRIPNPNAADGMMSSAKAAGAWPGWDDGLTHVAIALIDQPQIPLELIKRLADFSHQRPASICQPEQAGKRGHPVFFPWADFCELGDAMDASLRDFVHQRSARRESMQCDDACIHADLNTPQDFQNAVALFSS